MVPLFENAHQLNAIEGGKLQISFEGCVFGAWLNKAVGISGKPVARFVWKDLHALPQYNIGRSRRVTEIYSILPTLPNLHLAGNYLKGRSIGDCADIAYRVAENLHSRLQRKDI